MEILITVKIFCFILSYLYILLPLHETDSNYIFICLLNPTRTWLIVPLLFIFATQIFNLSKSLMIFQFYYMGRKKSYMGKKNRARMFSVHIIRKQPCLKIVWNWVLICKWDSTSWRRRNIFRIFNKATHLEDSTLKSHLLL